MDVVHWVLCNKQTPPQPPSRQNSLHLHRTGASVSLKWENDTGAVVSAAMTVSAPLTGVATYQFTASQLYSPSMSFEVVITDAGGKVTSNLDVIPVIVRARLA